MSEQMRRQPSAFTAENTFMDYAGLAEPSTNCRNYIPSVSARQLGTATQTGKYIVYRKYLQKDANFFLFSVIQLFNFV